MPFDAGSIEATLTLNRNPFTAGLAAAKQQVAEFKRRNSPIEVDVKVNLRQRELDAIEARLKKFGATVAKATAEVVVKGRAAFDRLLFDLTIFATKTYTANVDVDAGKATAEVIAFKKLLSSLNDQTVNLSANTRAFGRAAGDGFGEGTSRFERLAAAVILGLPVIASGFTATVGAVGALASALVIAGLGAGAFALVAVPAFNKVKDAVAGGQKEIDKLPPGLREAGNGLKELLTEYDKLVVANQRVVGISLSAWFNAGTAALKTLNPLIQAAATAFGLAGVQAIRFFNSPWWSSFVQFLSGAIGPAVDMLFRGIFALIQIIGNLTKAFWDLGGSEIMGMIVKGLEDFARWTERIGQNKTFQAFMEAAKRSLPVVGALLGAVLEFVFKLAIGLEPLGTIIIRVITGIFDVLNKIPPPFLQAIALAIGAIWAAMALGAGGPVAIAIGVLAGLGAIFADAYTKSDTLKKGLQNLGDYISAQFAPIWKIISDNYNQYIKPAWDDLVRRVRDDLIPSLQKFIKTVIDEVVPRLKPFVDIITREVIPAVLNFLGALGSIIGFLVDTFGPTIARELKSAVDFFSGTFQTIAGLLNVFTGIFTGDWDKFFQGLKQIGQGVLTAIAALFGLTWEDVKKGWTAFSSWFSNAWTSTLEGIRSIWNGFSNWLSTTWNSFWNGIKTFVSEIWASIRLFISGALDLLRGDVDSAAQKIGEAWRKIANLFREPINWVIRTVIGPPGGIAGAWNTVMGWIGQPQLSVSAPPQIPAFARGGVLPGYAPRRDSLIAAVSPGEAVMVPEWTKAVGGSKAVAAMNAAAIKGDLYGEGVRRTYSLGGTIPHFAYGGVASNVAAAGDEIQRVFGAMPGGIGGVGARANASDHPRGYALDFMVLNNRGLGNRIADYFFANWSRLTTKYIIWLQRIASSPGAWRGMADRGSPTANHMDHVHASFLGAGEAPLDGSGGGAPAQVSWWSIIAGKVTSLIKGLFGGSIPGLGGPMGQAISRIPGAIVDKTIDALKSKLEGLMTVVGTAINTTAESAAANPLSGMGTADRGAIIPPGPSMLFNATGRPEPLTNLDVYERMKPAGLTIEDVLALLKTRDGGGDGDVYNVMLPEKASVRELADQLDFKRKVVRMGRYSR